MPSLSGTGLAFVWAGYHLAMFNSAITMAEIATRFDVIEVACSRRAGGAWIC
jgi:hypothetical protein